MHTSFHPFFLCNVTRPSSIFGILWQVLTLVCVVNPLAFEELLTVALTSTIRNNQDKTPKKLLWVPVTFQPDNMIKGADKYYIQTKTQVLLCINNLGTSLIQVFADVLLHNKKPFIALIFTLCLFSNIINIHVWIWTSLTQQTCQAQHSLSNTLK